MFKTFISTYYFMPYEYRAFEEYLQKKALSGLQLVSYDGIFVKFKKTTPKKLKYSVDILDKVTIFDDKNSQSALEYRELCEASGWTFVCENSKYQIFRSEIQSEPSKEEPLEIQTDEEIKFKNICKTTMKKYLLTYFYLLIFYLFQLDFSINNLFLMFLTDKATFISVSIGMIFVLSLIVSFINFIYWIGKAKNNLKVFGFVNYETNLINKVTLSTMRFGFVSLVIAFSYIIFINSPLLLMLLFLGAILIIIGSNIYNRLLIKGLKPNKNADAILIYICVLLFSIFAVSKSSNINDNNLNLALNNLNPKYKLTFNTLGYTDIPENNPTTFVTVNDGYLAQKIDYFYNLDDYGFNYILFEGSRESFKDYYLNKTLNYKKTLGNNYEVVKTNLPSEVTVYRYKTDDFNGNAVMTFGNTVIEVYSFNKNIDIFEFLERIYSNLK